MSPLLGGAAFLTALVITYHAGRRHGKHDAALKWFNIGWASGLHTMASRLDPTVFEDTGWMCVPYEHWTGQTAAATERRQ